MLFYIAESPDGIYWPGNEDYQVDNNYWHNPDLIQLISQDSF